jgi:hypothetical protein
MFNRLRFPLVLLALLCFASNSHAQVRYPLPYPPKLPGNQTVVVDTSDEFLVPGPNLRAGVAIAKTPPTVTSMYYPGQDYPGNPWCFRAVGIVRGDKYYSALCDHLAPGGTAYLYEYDAAKKSFRLLLNTTKYLRGNGQIPPDAKYSPGEIQTRIDMGSDGWLYYGTTRGSTTVTTDANGFRGEWVLKTNPATAETEVVRAFPVARHCLLASVLDPERMVFYGGTAAGDRKVKDVRFFALDVRTGKILKEDASGFDRYAIFSKSTGCVYWEGRKYDPRTNELTASVAPHVRSATPETPQGLVYGTSHYVADLWAFDVQKETLTPLGSGAVGTQGYVASMHADPTGRYVYYIPGAHGGATKDGTPVVQYDTKRGTLKVLCFLHKFYQKNYGYNPDGCFCSVLDEKGERLFVSWDGWREGQPRGWESCMLSVIEIPESERVLD